MATTRTHVSTFLTSDSRATVGRGQPGNVWVNLDGDTLLDTGTAQVFPSSADQADALAVAFAEAAQLLREAAGETRSAHPAYTDSATRERALEDRLAHYIAQEFEGHAQAWITDDSGDLLAGVAARAAMRVLVHDR